MMNDSNSSERSAARRARKGALVINAPSGSRSESDESRMYTRPLGASRSPRLIEQQSDVAVIRAGVPGAVGQIARFARKGRRARYDDVEQRIRRERGKKVRAHRSDAIPEAVGTRVFGRRKRGIGVYVDSADLCGTRPGCSKRENSRSRAHISHSLAARIEPPDERRKKLAGDEIARVKHSRPHDHPEPGRPRAPCGTPLQDEMIRKEMNRAAQPAPPLAMRDAAAVEAASGFECWTTSCIALLSLFTLTSNP
jgi:hypothetical protein